MREELLLEDVSFGKPFLGREGFGEVGPFEEDFGGLVGRGELV